MERLPWFDRSVTIAALVSCPNGETDNSYSKSSFSIFKGKESKNDLRNVVGPSGPGPD